MAYTFKAKCIKNDQSSIGNHVATLQGAAGETFGIPSSDMLCKVGNEYTVTVDGEFTPKPVKAAPAVAPKPVAPLISQKPVFQTAKPVEAKP